MRLPVHGSSVCVCAWSLAEEDEETIKLFWKREEATADEIGHFD